MNFVVFGKHLWTNKHWPTDILARENDPKVWTLDEFSNDNITALSMQFKYRRPR